MKLTMTTKPMKYMFSCMVERENSLYDTEGARLIVEAGRGGSALEAGPHCIQVLLGVEDELLESVGTGYVARCLEMFTGLCAHLSAPTIGSLACECVCVITVPGILCISSWITIIIIHYMTNTTTYTLQDTNYHSYNVK